MKSLCRRLDRLLGCVIPLVATGCGVTDPDVVRVELSVDRAFVSQTQPLGVVVTATNGSDHSLLFDAHDCPQVFEVAPLGQVEAVGPESVVCSLALLVPTELAPGESMSFHYTWRGHGVGEGEEPLAPGVYRLRGWATPSGGSRVYSGYVQVEVRSP